MPVIHWAEAPRSNIAGAFLVAPPDPYAPGASKQIREFEAAHSNHLPFPALLVGSENDPYASKDSVQELAEGLNCAFRNAGSVGHINVASGHGLWTEGWIRFHEFLASLRSGQSLAA